MAPRPTAAANPDAASSRTTVREPSPEDGCPGAIPSGPPRDRLRPPLESVAMPGASGPGRKPSPTSAAGTSGSAPRARSRAAAAEQRLGVPARDWASQVGTEPPLPASASRDGPHGARHDGPLRGTRDRHDAPLDHREAALQQASKPDSGAAKTVLGRAQSRGPGKASLHGNLHDPSDSFPSARSAGPDGILPFGSDAAPAAATASAAPRQAEPRTSRRTSMSSGTGLAVGAVPDWSASTAGKRAHDRGERAPALKPMTGSKPDDAQAIGDVLVGPASCAAGPSQ